MEGDKDFTVREEVVLEENTSPRSRTESLAFLSSTLPLIGNVGDFLIKAATKIGADQLKKFASGFEASYSASLQLGRKNELGGDEMLDRYPLVFRRTVIYKNEQEALKDFFKFDSKKDKPAHFAAGTTRKIAPGEKYKEGAFAVDALRYEFDIVIVDRDAGVMQIVPQSLIHQGSKAKKASVPFTKDDDLKLALLVSIKQPLQSNFSVTSLSASSFEKKRSLLNTDDLVPKNNKEGGEWLPAPKSKYFSVEVIAIESSDVKKMLEKAAENLAKLGGN